MALSTRRELLLMTMAARGAWPQSAYPGTPYRDYSHCLPDYLRDLAQHAYRRRNEAIAKLTTPDAIARRRQGGGEIFGKWWAENRSVHLYTLALWHRSTGPAIASRTWSMKAGRSFTSPPIFMSPLPESSPTRESFFKWGTA